MGVCTVPAPAYEARIQKTKKKKLLTKTGRKIARGFHGHNGEGGRYRKRDRNSKNHGVLYVLSVTAKFYNTFFFSFLF